MLLSHIYNLAICAACLAMFAAGPALASEEAAIVESLTSDREELQELNFLASGKTFVLHANEAVTLVYLDACIQEVITGGKVTIGDLKSTIIGGSVTTTAIECETNLMTASQ